MFPYVNTFLRKKNLFLLIYNAVLCLEGAQFAFGGDLQFSRFVDDH